MWGREGEIFYWFFLYGSDPLEQFERVLSFLVKFIILIDGEKVGIDIVIVNNTESFLTPNDPVSHLQFLIGLSLMFYLRYYACSVY